MDARSPSTRSQIAADEARGAGGIEDDVAHVLGKLPRRATLCGVWTLSSRGSASWTTSAEQRQPPMTNRVLSDVANTLRSDRAPEILTAQVNWSAALPLGGTTLTPSECWPAHGSGLGAFPAALSGSPTFLVVLMAVTLRIRQFRPMNPADSAPGGHTWRGG
ncbi:hypothetical protein [Micromonospora sp. CPCC 206061]|uniref:hypothetical protein n=1 Tax=Micromonospora sp. CPCC 206061 TaxID=3122410 RepID=UPI002FF11710